MDGSGSVGNCEFQRGKAAIKNMMKSANAVAVKNKFDETYAAVTFASSAKVNFKFLPYSTADQRLTIVQFPSGSTNTQAGLAEARKLFVESLTGICFAVTKFLPVGKLCWWKFSRNSFHGGLESILSSVHRITKRSREKSGFAAKPVVVPRAPAKFLRKEKKNVCQQARLPGIIATAFNYLTPRRIYFHDCLTHKSHALFVPGGRFADHKNVLLITDGQSNVHPTLTVPNADKLKRLGVNIYVFAVGDYIPGIGEMVQVAGSKDSTKPDPYLFRLKGYPQLWEFTKLVVTKLASTGKYISLSPQPSPC